VRVYLSEDDLVSETVDLKDYSSASQLAFSLVGHSKVSWNYSSMAFSLVTVHPSSNHHRPSLLETPQEVVKDCVDQLRTRLHGDVKDKFRLGRANIARVRLHLELLYNRVGIGCIGHLHCIH
jgi:hypothetical protein